jgi:hypothetical protein
MAKGGVVDPSLVLGVLRGLRLDPMGETLWVADSSQ